MRVLCTQHNFHPRCVQCPWRPAWPACVGHPWRVARWVPPPCRVVGTSAHCPNAASLGAWAWASPSLARPVPSQANVWSAQRRHRRPCAWLAQRGVHDIAGAILVGPSRRGLPRCGAAHGLHVLAWRSWAVAVAEQQKSDVVEGNSGLANLC